MADLTYDVLRRAMALIPSRPFIKTVEPPALIVCHIDHVEEVRRMIGEPGVEVRGSKYVDFDMVYLIQGDETWINRP